MCFILSGALYAACPYHTPAAGRPQYTKRHRTIFYAAGRAAGGARFLLRTAFSVSYPCARGRMASGGGRGGRLPSFNFPCPQEGSPYRVCSFSEPLSPFRAFRARGGRCPLPSPNPSLRFAPSAHAAGGARFLLRTPLSVSRLPRTRRAVPASSPNGRRRKNRAALNSAAPRPMTKYRLVKGDEMYEGEASPSCGIVSTGFACRTLASAERYAQAPALLASRAAHKCAAFAEENIPRVLRAKRAFILHALHEVISRIEFCGSRAWTGSSAPPAVRPSPPAGRPL